MVDKSFSEVSVIVSTYNRPRALNLVLFGLMNQTIRPSQIVIADDGSDQETGNLINAWRERSNNIEHCWQEDLGFRKARILNRALEKIKASRVIFLDGDCVPFNSFVEDHLRMSHAGYFLAGTRVLASEAYTAKLERQERLDEKSWCYWLKRRLAGETNSWFPLMRLPDLSWRYLSQMRWKLFRGCNFSVFTADLLRVDGFDEALTGWGREDSDLAIRLLNSGIRLKNLKYAAQVIHLWHKDESRDRLNQNDFELRKAIAERRVIPRAGISRIRLNGSLPTK